MINIKEKDGEIVFNETQNFSQQTILQKYRNDSLTKRFIEAQLKKAPQEIKEFESEKDLINLQIEQIQKRIKQFETIFNKRNIDPKTELKKLRETYTDEELTKKAEKISQRQSFELKDMGNKIERIIKNYHTIEELIILYVSNQYHEINANERLMRINKDIERIQTKKEAQEEELEKVNDSMQSIKLYFKKKRLDIDRLLDQQATERKKGQKEVGEIPLR